jgi:hypothetical protein
MINLDDNLGSATTRRAHVQAHGEIEEDFTGEVTRTDEENYVTFVRHPDTGQVWGCNNAFVTLRD